MQLYKALLNIIKEHHRSDTLQLSYLNNDNVYNSLIYSRI